MKRLAIITAVVLSTLACLYAVWELRTAVLIFFLSLGTSAALRPAIEWLMSHGLPKAAALTITYVALLVGFVGLVVALAFPLANNMQQIATDFGNSYKYVAENWPQGNSVERAVAARLPDLAELEKIAWQADSDTLSTVLGITTGFLDALLHFVIIIVLSLYWSIDRVHFERLWLSLLDVDHRRRARDTWRAVEHATGAYLQREAGQSFSAGSLLVLGFLAIGQPYPVLSATIGALAWLIPYVGSLLAMLAVMAVSLPAVISGDSAGPMVLVASATYTLIVLVLLEVVVEPRLFSQRRYNPILLLLVAVGLVDWLGILGLLIAPPVAATLQIVGGQFAQRRSAAAETRQPTEQLPLEQRLAMLRARLADVQDPPEGIKELVHRLDALVAKARNKLEQGN